MSHYKVLNKELVEQVQTMKIQLNLYCTEIVSLKRDMMQKHETQVFLRKKCFNWAVENFKKLLETVEPECPLIDQIQEYVPVVEVVPSLTRNVYQRSNSLRSSNEDRRTSELRLELQRSNSVIHSRKSMCTISPARHSSAVRSQESDVEIDIPEDEEPLHSEVEVESQKQVYSDHIIFEESEDEVEEQDMELESEKEMSQEEKNNETASKTLQHKNIEIYEESDATAEEEETHNADSSQYESVEEITIDISSSKIMIEESHTEDVTEISMDQSPAKLALSDLTNTHSSQQKKPKEKRKRGRPHLRRTLNRTKKLTSNDESHESTTDTSPAIVSDRQSRPQTLDYATTQKSVAITRRRDQMRSMDLRDKSMELDESIQQNRENVSVGKYNADRRKSIRMPDITQEVSMATTSFAISDMTLQNFNTAVASSTPNSRHNSIRTVTENKVALDSPPPLSTSKSSRPSRKCKPKDLVEPKLGSKMRNETKKAVRKYTKKK